VAAAAARPRSEKCDAYGRERLARGESFMPEHTFQFKYEGEPLLESETIEAFVAGVKKISWPW
jgi:hypothetical protein